MQSAMPSNRPRLSVAMIVRDEEAQLPRSLASVRGIADQILVADTGSQDRSCRVALEYGAHVVSVPWQDDFSAARNRCLEYLTGDWILWLDAGERLSPRCCDSLRSFVNSQPDTNEAWLMMVELPPDGMASNGERIGRIRMVPRRDELCFTGRVRETLRPAIEAAGMSIKIGPWRIERTARDHVTEVKRARAVRDLRLIEQAVQADGTSYGMLLALADGCAALGENDKALSYYRQAILDAPRGSTEMLAAYYGLLTSLPDGSAGNAQLETCIEALEVFPYDAQLLCAMGSYLQAQGHHPLAQRSYRAAHEFGEIDPETWHVGTIGEVAAECLSLNLQLLSDDAAALKVLEDCQTRYPKSHRLSRRRLELYVKSGQLSEALAELERLGIDPAQQTSLRTAVQGAAVASQKNWIAAIPYLETAYAEGCRDPLCLRWYTVALHETGDYNRAREIAGAWLAVEPDCRELDKIRRTLADEQAVGAGASQGAPTTGSTPHFGFDPHAASFPRATT